MTQEKLKVDELLQPHYQNNYREDIEQTTTCSSREILSLTKQQKNELTEFSNEFTIGMADIFLGLISTYFSLIYSRSDLIFGLPFHNRKNFQQKKMLGAFTSISPLSIDIDKDFNFVDIVKSINVKLRRIQRHQRYPIGHIYNDLNQQTVGKPLYDVGYNYLRLDSNLNFDGQPADLVYLSHNHEVTPIMFTIWEYGDSDQIDIKIDYNHAYFTKQEIKQLRSRLSCLLDSVLSKPSRKIANTTILDQQLNYWDKQLENFPPVHSLPLTHVRPEHKGNVIAAVKSNLSVDLSRKLQDLAKKYELTPFMFLHAALSLLIYR